MPFFIKLRTLVSPTYFVPFAFLAYWLAFTYESMSRALFRTWFFNSDEYVLAAEIIRFSNLDFRQHFFDIPGTFFMLLDTSVWAAFYGIERALGLAPGTGLEAFTFQRISGLFVLMRATTLGCFLLSAVLLFALAAKLMNPGAGALASLLLLMSPGYASYSSFARTESLAMVLILGAILWLMRGIERNPLSSTSPPGLRDHSLVAGVLVGLAAGVRLHSITAALPPMVIMLWIERPFAKPAYPRWILVAAKWALPAAWITAGLVFYLSTVRLNGTPGAQHFLMAVTLACGLGSLSAMLLYVLPRTRPVLVRAISPDIIKLALGCLIGGVLGNPTVLRQYNYFLGSVQMYSRFVDVERLHWSFWRNVTWYVRHYMDAVAPDRISLALLCAGAIWILIARDRRLIPFLAAAALFFFSKPLALEAAPHHVILWLPFFYLVCAYPAGKLIAWLSTRLRHGEVWATATLALGLYGCFQALPPGPGIAVADATGTELRLHNIERATAWIKSNAEPNAPVAISYYCFNPDIFYTWLRSLEVPVPASVFDGRDYMIWWGHARALQGKTGYVCATPSDVETIKTRLDAMEPGQGTDPYTDAGFRRVASFGAGASEVDLFRFDYR